MKNVLLIGVGGTGSSAVDILYKKIDALGNEMETNVSAIVFDTDKGDISSIQSATAIPMTDPDSVGIICDRLGKEKLGEWFPCYGENTDKAVMAQELVRGASQWRKKSFLSFLNLMNKASLRMKLNNVLENVVKDATGACEVYVITSVAGGTGSGSFIPIALYVKKYMRDVLGKSPLVNAMIALPDIYIESQQLSENKIKICANAYAIMREINAINLVAYDRFGENSRKKKAPIHIKYGNEDDPNTRGVLFDSEDPRFWVPEAAPFNQIFLVDRIKGCTSVDTHKMQMADSLYNMICTGIGNAFDSEQSNHEMIHAQSNASSAIFASVATTQLRFPIDSVLDYLAYEKALEVCDGEWLALYYDAKKKEQQKIKEAKDRGERYVAKDGDYARMFIDSLDDERNNGKNAIVDVAEFGTTTYSKEDDAEVSTVNRYYDSICSYLRGTLNRINIKDKLLSEKKVSLGKLKSTALGYYNTMFEQYKENITKVRGLMSGFPDSILSFDRKRTDAFSGDLSLVKAILMTPDGKRYLHPVAAMTQLCKLRLKMLEEEHISSSLVRDDFSKREVEKIPQGLLSKLDPCKGGKTLYHKAQNDRFCIVTDPTKIKVWDSADPKGKKNWKTAAATLALDAQALSDKIMNECQLELEYRAFQALGRIVDLLIAKYRFFFSRFEKEKDELIEERNNALIKDSFAESCGVFNVFSSEDAKKWIRKRIFSDLGAQSMEELTEANDTVGRGVWTTVYEAACAEENDDTSYNDKDSSGYHNLFYNMFQSYKRFIGKSDAFAEYKSYTIVEAIEAECKRHVSGTPESKFEMVIGELFGNIIEKSKPTLMINRSASLDNVIMPNACTVFMISANTAKYIKKSAQKFNLTLNGDQDDSSDMVKACAEDLIKRYARGEGVRLVISKTLPDNILYCSTELMDVSPLRLTCFDEMAHEGGSVGIKMEDLTLDEQKKCSKLNFINYYDAYMIAIRRAKFHETDMWNPHLGFDWHRRGNLPFMNEKMEKECDDKMVKALIFGINNGLIYKEKGNDGMYYASHISLGGTKRIYLNGKTQVTDKNICKLISWFRNQDEIIEDWSVQFDREIDRIKKKLPTLKPYNPNDKTGLVELETKLSDSSFMHILYDSMSWRESIRNDPSAHEMPCLLEFAYMIKLNEETDRDCDDAERILDVAYSVFMELVMHKTENSTGNFNHVYRQQCGGCQEGSNSIEAGKVYDKLMQSVDPADLGDMVTWMNDAQKFMLTSGMVNEDVLSSITLRFDKEKIRASKAFASENKQSDDDSEKRPYEKRPYNRHN